MYTGTATIDTNANTVRVNGRDLPILDSMPRQLTGYMGDYAYRSGDKIIVSYRHYPRHLRPDVAKQMKDAYAALARVRSLWSKAHAAR